MVAASTGYSRLPPFPLLAPLADRISAGRRLRSGTPQDVRDALAQVRGRTFRLARAWADRLGGELAVPLHPWLNPPRWELGHVAWFEQRWLARNPQWRLGWRCDPEQPRLLGDFAAADDLYDSSSVAHDARWHLALPGLEQTLAWMERTRAGTLALLDNLPAGADDDALYFFRLCALHEAMHAEAACYMVGTLGFDEPLAPPATGPCAEGALAVAPCRWCLGGDGADGSGFAFDNELRAHVVQLDAFEIDRDLVSWARYGRFVQAGGYEQPRWWTAAGWQWRQRARPGRPRFPEGDAPALHLSAHEADAWCLWAGRSLPSEAQWEVAACTLPGFDWGRAWEWTASVFQPYPGFEPHPYHDYSAPWFGTRRVLRAASAATPDLLVSPRFRNFFEPDRTDIVAGFRSCRALSR